MHRLTARVVTPTVRVFWVVYRVVVLLVVVVMGVGCAGDAAGWWLCCRWWRVMQVTSQLLGTDLSSDWG